MTLWIPPDLTRNLSRRKGLAIDELVIEKAMEEQKKTCSCRSKRNCEYNGF
jgi:alanyl-tRNA synthetase